MNFAANGEKEREGLKQADAKAVTWERGCGGKGKELCHRLKTSRYLWSENVGGWEGLKILFGLILLRSESSGCEGRKKGGITFTISMPNNKYYLLLCFSL